MEKLDLKRSEVGGMFIRMRMAFVFLIGLGMLPAGARAQCDAFAGTLSTSASLCLQAVAAEIIATPSGDAVVPAGYEIEYFLTSGSELVIVQTSDVPVFSVALLGDYTVHTLVYDPVTLDLSTIVPGVTTGFDVNALLIQGGGTICASLDVTGASVMVADPDAGGLTADTILVCIGDGAALIAAMPDGDMEVPEGYSVTYILTSTPGYIYHDMNAMEPVFTVGFTGMHTIHTLVYQPETFDLSALVPGVTTASDIHGMLVQGGGSICGSFDIGGAEIFVIDCVLEECEAFAGTATATSPFVCLDEGMAMISATLDGNMVAPEGFIVNYVLSMQGGGLVIEQMSAEPSFMVSAEGTYFIHTLVYDPLTLDLSFVVPGVTTGLEVATLLVQQGGDICADLDLIGAIVQVGECPDECMADAGGLTASNSQVCLDDAGTMISAMASGGLMVPDGYSVKYVLTAGAGLVIEQVADAPSFMVASTGMYTIHTLVYDPMTLDISVVVTGVTTGADVNALLLQGGGEICASLDLTGAMIHVVECPGGDCTAYAGSLIGLKDIFCYLETGSVIGANVVGDNVVPPGYVTKWLVTHGAGQVIVDIGDMAWFVVDGMGLYTIHTLVYNPATLDLSMIVLGTTTAAELNAMLIQGGGEICASLDTEGVSMTVDEPLAGMLTPSSDMVCLEDGSAMISATLSGSYLPMGYMHTYILAMGGGMTIMETSSSPEFMVTSAGNYSIHTLVHDELTFPFGMIAYGATTISDLHAMLVPGGGIYCADLDVTGAMVNVMDCTDECQAYAGSLESIKDIFCYMETGSVIGAIVVGDNVVPPGYVTKWVVTHGAGQVIVDVGDMSWFVVDGMGLYTIHTLVYDPNTLDLSMIDLGTTTAAEVNALLIQGGGTICASLDLEGVSLTVDEPMAGTLTPDMPMVCLEGGSANISASVSGSYLPMGYDHLYILAMGEDMTIMETSAVADFTVSGMGWYSIHTLVHDPLTFPYGMIVAGSTTIADLHAMLVPGGGAYCAALDITGAMVHVMECDTDCTADAGTLTPDDFETCLAEGSVMITAEGEGDMIVPMGYQVKYVLTSGAEMVIVDVSDMLAFEVTMPGDYTFHTLVYHPATLDLSIVVPGVTTASDVNMLLIQGGGTICASLDLIGGTTHVIDCSTTCEASVGTVPSFEESICFSGDPVMISIDPITDATVPDGYVLLYLLTHGLTPEITEWSTVPEFTINSTGLWSITAFVYDPMAFDLGDFVTVGVTNVFDLQAEIQADSLCASLDLFGANFGIFPGACCTAEAGTLTSDDTDLCLTSGVALFGGSHVTEPVVPDGFSVIYVLTSGTELVVHQINTLPVFVVNAPGMYTAHTLVHNSDLDLGQLTIGESTAFDVHELLIQGGGTICGALDVTGVSFMVEECLDCMAFAGTLTTDSAEVCLIGGMATLSAVAGGDAVVPFGSSVIYVLTSGPMFNIMDVSESPEFMVEMEGSFTVHTLVYDPLTLNLGSVVIGETSALDVAAMIDGIVVCASLDLVGVGFTAIDCTGGLVIHNAWPVPAVDQLTVQLSVPASSHAQLLVFNADGSLVMPAQVIAPGTNQVVLNVASLGAGFYTIRLMDTNGLSNLSFTKTH